MSEAYAWEKNLTQTTAFCRLDFCYQTSKIVARASMLESFRYEDQSKYDYEI